MHIRLRTYCMYPIDYLLPKPPQYIVLSVLSICTGVGLKWNKKSNIYTTILPSYPSPKPTIVNQTSSTQGGRVPGSPTLSNIARNTLNLLSNVPTARVVAPVPAAAASAVFPASAPARVPALAAAVAAVVLALYSDCWWIFVFIPH